MPIIDPAAFRILASPEEGPFGVPAFLFAFGLMVSGGDARKAEKCLERMIGQAVFEGLQELSRSAPSEVRVVPFEMVELVSERRSPRESFVEAAVGEWWCGQVAGEILWTVLRLAVNFEKLASVNTAVEMVREWNRRRGLPHARSTIMAAWELHKSTSHLWAAFNRWPHICYPFVKILFEEMDCDRVSASELQHIVERPMADPFSLPLFFGFAEALRRDGERHHARGKRKLPTLLRPDEAWRLPPEAAAKLPLPIDVYPKLNDDELALLAQG